MTSSGVVGHAGRYPLPSRTSPRAADLVLAGSPLPLTGTLRVYTCGITPYDVTHLGHAATFVWADLLARVARALEVRPITARNVTDVDDVLTLAAGERQRHYDELAVTQEFLFERDMTDLGVGRPDLTPHARAHVPQVIQLVDALMAAERAYEVDGTVWFAAPDDLDRDGLSDEQVAALLEEYGDRSGGDGRRAPLDVPVWKPSSETDPAWPSPWGWGRPAWHVECAAMASTVLGSTVDVLAGGADLAFPHHAYQAAMVEAATGSAPFARRTMHVGTVHHDGSKMAKSTGNLVLVRDLLADHPGPVLRTLLLHRRWADDWDYTPDLLAGAAERLADLHAAAGRPGAGESTGRDTAGRDTVLAALADDLDVPTAWAAAVEHGGDAARTLVGLLRL